MEFKFDTSKPIRLFECFAGIGTQALAFKRLGIEYEVVGISEIDKFALLSYAAIHTDYLKIRDTFFGDNDLSKEYMISVLQSKNVGYDFKKGKHSIYDRTGLETVRDYYLADHLTKNYGDISLIKGSDLPKDIDMLTYSFPCTDISISGRQAGLENTRSGLVYEVFRILIELEHYNNKPKSLVMENVLALIQKKFIGAFQDMQKDLNKLGYDNTVMRLTGHEHSNVAQRRERVFMVSTPLDTYAVAPKPIELTKKLGDYLEFDVDESFYLTDAMYEYLSTDHPKHKRKKKFFKNQRDRYGQHIANTITTRETSVVDSTFIKEDDDRIRKMTPRECWRLMGIDDSDFEKAQQVSSNAQLYKQAGNAIIVDVFAVILKEMI